MLVSTTHLISVFVPQNEGSFGMKTNSKKIKMLNKKRTQTLGFVKIKLGIQVSVFIVQAILTLTKPSKGQDEHILLCEE